MTYNDILNNHLKLGKRNTFSEEKYSEIQKKFENDSFFKAKELSIFSAGSLARGEIGKKSDLDLFVIANLKSSELSKLLEYEIYGKLIQVVRELGYPEFSNDGEFLKVHTTEEIISKTGTPKDDHENLFTERMLLLLESKPVINESIHKEIINKVIGNYFRDSKGKKTFRALFLLNDLLRYWRTLCLNYEDRRSQSLPWIKKNINLKFSRMLTVFSTILPLISQENFSSKDLSKLCELRPLERLAAGLDFLGTDEFKEDFITFLDIYEEFLTWKEVEDIDTLLKEQKANMREKEEYFSSFLYRALTHKNIKKEYTKYLIL